MHLKRFFIAVTVAVLLIIGVIFLVMFLLNNNVPESSPAIISSTEDSVMNYLIEEKEYDKKDISTVKSEREPKSSDITYSGYTIEVIFTDEPSAVYLYQVKEDKVHQFGFSGPAKKHLDLDE